MKLSLLGFLCLTLCGYNHGFTLGAAITRKVKMTSPSFRRHIQKPPRNTPTCGSGPLSSTETSLEERDRLEAARSDKMFGILVLLTVPLSWGTYVPVVRYLYAIQPPVPGFVFSACYYALAAITTSALAFWQSRRTTVVEESPAEKAKKAIPILGGIELGGYLFIANCLQVIGLRTVESDRAGFLVQLTTVMVPFVEALFAGNLVTVPIRTWFACFVAFIGLFVMGLDGKIVSDPISALVAALSSFSQGDTLIIGAAVLYTLHVVRLGAYAKTTSPMKLAASKATAETIFSVLLVGALTGLSTVVGEQSGLLGFASTSGKEILNFFSSFWEGISNGSLSRSVLLPAVAAVFWTGWVTCAYTIYAQSFGQSRVTPTNANLIYTFQPIFTALFGWLLLGETMGPSGFVGGAIIASSVYLVAAANLGESKAGPTVDDNTIATTAGNSIRTSSEEPNSSKDIPSTGADDLLSARNTERPRL